jgi:hypothetical protein
MKKNILSKLTLGKRTVAALSTESMAMFNGGTYAYTSFYNCPPNPGPVPGGASANTCLTGSNATSGSGSYANPGGGGGGGCNTGNTAGANTWYCTNMSQPTYC